MYMYIYLHVCLCMTTNVYADGHLQKCVMKDRV